MTNIVRDLRLSEGVSLRALATTVNAPQAVIRRIEANKRLAEIGLARKICATLSTTIEWAFPGSANALAALEDDMAVPKHASRETFEKLRAVGLEADTRRNTLKVILRGHAKPMLFSFDSHELDRLFSAVQNEDNDVSCVSFVVFDSEAQRVAINLRSMVFCQFLWDSSIGYVIQSERETIAEESESQRLSVQVYFENNVTPVCLEAEFEDGDDIENENENNYVNAMFCALDSGGLRSTERLHIVDEDGESAFIRAGDISLVTAALPLLDQNYRDNEDEDEDDDAT